MSTNVLTQLLAETLVAPDDESRRRIFADHVRSLSSWQSELMICQCDIAKLKAQDPFRRNYLTFGETERKLLAHFKVFTNGCIRLLPELSVNLHRGFLEEVTSDISTFVDHAEECLSVLLFPFLNRLILTGGEANRISEFKDCQMLSRFEHIWFAEILLSDAGLGDFLNSRFITQLRSLNFHNWGDWKDKSKLRELGGILSSEGIRRLASTEALSGLESLDLCFHDLGAEGVRYLASTKVLASLSTLNVDTNEIGDEGLTAIGESTSLKSLTCLSARGNNLSFEGAKALLDSRKAPALRFLNLSGNELGSEFGSLIKDGKGHDELEVLAVSNCGLGAKGFAALLESRTIPRCRSLTVSYNGIGAEFFRLFQADSSLVHISAAMNEIPDLIEPYYWGKETSFDSKLVSLDVHGNQLGDGFARFLSTGKCFEGLQVLNLFSNPISDAGAEMICQSPHLRSLRQLSLSKRMLSESVTEDMRRRFGDGLILS